MNNGLLKDWHDGAGTGIKQTLKI